MPFRVRKNAVLCVLHPEVIRITPEEENSVCVKLLYVTFKSFFQSHHSGSCYGQSLKFMLLVILCITEGISVCNGFYHSPWIIAIRLPGHPHLFHFLPIHPLVFFSVFWLVLSCSQLLSSDVQLSQHPWLSPVYIAFLEACIWDPEWNFPWAAYFKIYIFKID